MASTSTAEFPVLSMGQSVGLWLDGACPSARILGADYCCVDLDRSKSGELFIMEIDSMPAWKGLHRSHILISPNTPLTGSCRTSQIVA